MISLFSRMLALLALPFFLLVSFNYAVAGNYFFVTLDDPPMQYAGESHAEGAAVRIVEQTMERIGHSVRIEVLPWARALKMVDLGQADAIFTIFANSQCSMFIDYSREVLVPQVVAFFAMRNHATTFEGALSTVRDKKIGVVSTIGYGSKFDFARPFLQIERTNTLEQNISKLICGRIDLFVSSIYCADFNLKKMGLSGRVVRIEPSIESVPSYIAFSKKNNLVELRDAFDLELKKIKDSGEYIQIMQQAHIVLPNESPGGKPCAGMDPSDPDSFF